MTEIKFKYWHLAALGFLIWLIGSWHGGWQSTPQSVFESLTDFIGGIMMWWGIAGDLLSNVTIQKGPIAQYDESAIREILKED